MKRTINYSERFMPTGLLLLRIGIGFMFMIHGFPKLAGGTEMWAKIGSVMGVIGLNFGFTFWGFMAAFAEFFGGLFLIMGLFTRLTVSIMLFNMIMAVCMHLSHGDNFGIMSHAIEDGIVFMALIFMGPGKLSLDYLFFRKKEIVS